MCKEDNKEATKRIVRDKILEELKKENILNFGIDILIIVFFGISFIGLVIKT